MERANGSIQPDRECGTDGSIQQSAKARRAVDRRFFLLFLGKGRAWSGGPLAAPACGCSSCTRAAAAISCAQRRQ